MIKQKEQRLSFSRLREVLYYDEETGIFMWKINTGKKRLAGKIAGSKMVRGYWMICVDYVQYAAHRVAWFYVTGRWPPHQIDHINGVRTDNRFVNLRLATFKQNMRNVKSRASHGYKGIVYCVNNRK